MSEACKNCVFWNTGGALGDPENRAILREDWAHYCRRFSPHGTWAYPTDWCGEYKHDPERDRDDW